MTGSPSKGSANDNDFNLMNIRDVIDDGLGSDIADDFSSLERARRNAIRGKTKRRKKEQSKRKKIQGKYGDVNEDRPTPDKFSEEELEML